jgi:DNA-binding transcriptional ArsR family regulator
MQASLQLFPKMKTLNASELLAALGHESRLAVFRMLVEAGTDGINASAISEKLGLAPATLSFHLAHLSRAGLITGRQVSRFIYYSANYAVMDELLAYLTNNCCQGEPCLPKSSARCAPTKANADPV